MEHVKILFTFHSDFSLSEDGLMVESLWAVKQENGFRIDSIPFFAPSIAWGDLVAAEFDETEGTLHYESLLQPSGHSTIQVVFQSLGCWEDCIRFIETAGCAWEGMATGNTLIAVDVSSQAAYEAVIESLRERESTGELSFRESCIGF